MSALTKRTALRMQLAQLDATACGGCGHDLGSHLPSMRGEQSFACNYWVWKYSGGVKAKQSFCNCKEFRDPAEQLPMDPKPEPAK